MDEEREGLLSRKVIMCAFFRQERMDKMRSLLAGVIDFFKEHTGAHMFIYPQGTNVEYD